MVQSSYAKNNILLITVLLFMSTFFCCLYAHNTLSFDRPFPTSAFERALTMSMRVSEGIADMSPEHAQVDKALMHDIIIGRIVCLCCLVKVLCQQHHKDILDSCDTDYLRSRIVSIAYAYQVIITQETIGISLLLVDAISMLDRKLFII